MKTNLIVFIISFLTFIDAVRQKLSLTDPKTLQETEFALTSLKKLSDSRIYQSLSLSRILRAEEEIGIYHDNTIVQVELSSPYFKSGDPTETYEFVIMTHHDDHVKSFAIDEFPIMDDFAIETHWIEKVKEKRRQKEESLRMLEINSIQQQTQAFELASATISRDIAIENMLLKLDSPSLMDDRIKNSALVEQTLADNTLKLEEASLSTMTLKDLYRCSISNDNINININLNSDKNNNDIDGSNENQHDSRCTNYQIGRSKDIIDKFFQTVNQ